MRGGSKRKCLRATKAFLRNVNDDLLSAFIMGLNDGERGEKQELPPMHDPSAGILYAQELLVLKMYERGYEAGKGGGIQ